MLCPFRPSHLKAFRDDRGGAAAVEFALVALPFLGLCAAVFQVAFQIWASNSFEHSLQSAARTIFTGQFQAETAAQKDPKAVLAKLRSRMCGADSGGRATLYDCAEVRIDVSTATSFGSSTPATTRDANTGGWNQNFGNNYTCAKPGVIVVVTAAVKIPTLFGLIGVDLRSFADGSHQLVSTSVFRTEPFQDPCSA